MIRRLIRWFRRRRRLVCIAREHGRPRYWHDPETGDIYYQHSRWGTAVQSKYDIERAKEATGHIHFLELDVPEGYPEETE